MQMSPVRCEFRRCAYYEVNETHRDFMIPNPAFFSEILVLQRPYGTVIIYTFFAITFL